MVYPVELATLFSSSVLSVASEASLGQLSISRLTQRQIYFTAIQAIPLIFISAVSVGSLIFFAFISLLPGFGLGHLVGDGSIFLISRELSPVLVAIIVISRSGTAIATELGNMKVNGEISLLESHGINIHYFLIFPRIAGMTVAMIVLNIFFGFFAILGGFTTSRLSAVSSEFPLYKFLDALELSFISVSLIKVMGFALIVSTVCCHHGLEPERSSTEVPRCATKAVMYSMGICILLNSFLSIYL